MFVTKEIAFEAAKPQRLGSTLTKEGAPRGIFSRWHKCRFLYIEASSRSDPKDMDRDPDGALALSMTTYVMDYRCKCGAEITERTRALI